MAYWYDGAALAATGSPVIALFWCLIKFTTTTTTTTTSVTLSAAGLFLQDVDKAPPTTSVLHIPLQAYVNRK